MWVRPAGTRYIPYTHAHAHAHAHKLTRPHVRSYGTQWDRAAGPGRRRDHRQRQHVQGASEHMHALKSCIEMTT